MLSAVLLAALGRVRDESTQLAILDRLHEFSISAQNSAIYSIAQDRGESTPDPNGVQVMFAFGSLADIAEPNVLRRLFDMAKEGNETSGLAPQNLTPVLALSAHRAPEIDVFLRDAAARSDPSGSNVAVHYLRNSRTATARSLAIEMIDADTARRSVIQSAFAALTRGPLDPELFRSRVLPAIERHLAAEPPRAHVLMDASQLLRPDVLDESSELALVALFRRALASGSVAEAGHAAVALSEAANWLGGWQGTGVDPAGLVGNESISISHRLSVIYRWSGRYYLGDHAREMEQILRDQSGPARLREAVWAGLERGATDPERTNTLRDLIRALEPEESDPDLREWMNEALKRGSDED